MSRGRTPGRPGPGVGGGERVTSRRGELARLGFTDPGRSESRLAALGDADDALLPLIAATADPDQALAGLHELLERLDPDERAEMLRALVDEEGTAMRLFSVLGASVALAEHLCRHPRHWHELRDPTLGRTRAAGWAVREGLLRAVGADPEAQVPVAAGEDGACVDALRVEYRRVLLRLAARDLAHDVRVDDVAAELSDLAAGTLEAALAVARARVGEPATTCRLAVVAMGKCGGHELNYVSDVDVIFVAEPADGADEGAALKIGTQLASHLMRVCSEHTGEGTIWPVDAALRPEGKSGPLVRTVASHRGYYERWAKTWEFQALLKARPVAGDRALGAEYVEQIKPMVWTASGRDGFVADVQAMRRRVLEHIPADEVDRQLKLGSGGLRDVEFAVQLLQMVHGRTDEAIRSATTLSALAALTSHGYVGREDGASLGEAYMFLRTLEHRIQLHRLRRTHVVPDDEESLRRLGRALGWTKDPVSALEERWRELRREVRRLHERLFYRPLLSAVASMGDGGALSEEAARDRLAALGFEDPAAALRHLRALSSGTTRTASIQRALMPALLQWFAEGADPDAGVFGFRRISEAVGSTPWYLRLLRDEGATAQRMARILSTSRYATDLLQREPEGIRLLSDEESLVPLSRSALETEMTATAGRQEGAEDAIWAVRGIRRRELLRVSSADLLGLIDVDGVAEALTSLTDATLEAALAVATQTVEEQRGTPLPTRFAIVAMGRYGGEEIGYGSDADVMFVHEPLEGAEPEAATSAARAVANEMRRLLALPGTDPALELDADLRPEGRQGPLVRTLESYRAYYGRWSAVWEAQALLRADPCIGDEGLRARFKEMIDPLRFPEGGLGPEGVLEVQRIKARVDAERLPRGADRATHLKLGRGGLADIEWTVQLLQMRHGGQVEGLRTSRTLKALIAAVEADVLSAEHGRVLAQAWRQVSRMRNAIVLVRGRPSDHLSRDAREKAAVASVLGYPQGESDRMVNDHLRITRQARAVVEEIFWG